MMNGILETTQIQLGDGNKTERSRRASESRPLGRISHPERLSGEARQQSLSIASVPV
jgi:hypothetical protein